MRRTISHRPVILGAVAAACGLLAASLTGNGLRAAARSARASFVDVTVAARAVPEGSALSPADVHVVRVPPEAAPPARVADPAGRTVTIPLLPGDPVVEGKLAPSGRGVSALLAPGQVAAPVVPAAPVAVAVGERVRITATFDPQRYAGRDLVRVVSASALVLARDEKDGKLVVALTLAERDQLALASATARLDVAVLAPGA